MTDFTEKEVEVAIFALNTLVESLDGLPAKDGGVTFGQVVELLEQRKEFLDKESVIQLALSARDKLGMDGRVA